MVVKHRCNALARAGLLHAFSVGISSEDHPGHGHARAPEEAIADRSYLKV